MIILLNTQGGESDQRMITVDFLWLIPGGKCPQRRATHFCVTRREQCSRPVYHVRETKRSYKLHNDTPRYKVAHWCSNEDTFLHGWTSNGQSRKQSSLKNTWRTPIGKDCTCVQEAYQQKNKFLEKRHRIFLVATRKSISNRSRTTNSSEEDLLLLEIVLVWETRI